MAESTLNVIWQELQGRVAAFLGWSRGTYYGETAWTDREQFELDGIVGSALRRFYHQAMPEGAQVAYSWSFLKPTKTFTLANGTNTLELPDDFGGFEDLITVVTTGSTIQPWRVEWRNEAAIRQMFSLQPTVTGPPMYVSQQPLKGTSATQGQRFQLYFFPTTDQDYTVQVQYYVNPDYLSTPFPYAYGGAQHAETILEGCLALAEKRLDDAMSVHAMEYEKCLAASVSIDRRNKPQKLGYNGDRSDQRDYRASNFHWWNQACTYNGQSFG